MSATSLEAALRTTRGPSIVAYLAAGFPDRETFLRALDALDRSADAIEIGIPFSDPMADGSTIQRASRVALENGATLDGTLRDLEALPARTPRVVMSYLNPLLSLPHDTLGSRFARAQISGVVVPDLPHDESGALAEALARHDIALVPMVTPLTRAERLAAIVRGARGFVYAVTTTGTTGQSVSPADAIGAYLERVRAIATVPVIAGFGIRAREHVAALCPPADGVVVGSALVEAIEAGVDLETFVTGLR